MVTQDELTDAVAVLKTRYREAGHALYAAAAELDAQLPETVRRNILTVTNHVTNVEVELRRVLDLLEEKEGTP